MADRISVPDIATNGSVTTSYPTSVEQVSTLNGAGVTPVHIQRQIVSARTSAGVAIDINGDSTFGLAVDVKRRPKATATAHTLVGINATTGVLLVAANTNRRGLEIFNDSNKTLRIKHATATPVVAPFRTGIPPKFTWEMPEPIVTDAVYGRWDEDDTDPLITGANITEMT